MKTILLSDMEFGIMVSVIGYLIVLSALAFLVGVYSLIPYLLNVYTKYKLKNQGKKCADKDPLELTGNEVAAIATSLYYILNERHDLESGTITIKKISKRYSPWSSKIYSMNNYKR
ncbi:MAG: hypothetical protein DSY76_03870 [Bacteroidetes bacterium]|nr:MAG: hypothetical protein DSY76_03870 [Bacteroidota bacterium]